MYILAGGSDLKIPGYGERIARVIKRETATPRILSCMFATEIVDREKKHREFDKWFNDNFGSECQVIHAEESSFVEQVRDSDVVYIHGGSTQTLIDTLNNYSSLKDTFYNKIIIGSSAGANFLSRVGFSPKKNQVIEGSGCVDVGVVVHYGISSFHGVSYNKIIWKNAVELVQSQVGKANTILLPEGEFVIIHTYENN